MTFHHINDVRWRLLLQQWSPTSPAAPREKYEGYKAVGGPWDRGWRHIQYKEKRKQCSESISIGGTGGGH